MRNGDIKSDETFSISPIHKEFQTMKQVATMLGGLVKFILWHKVIIRYTTPTEDVYRVCPVFQSKPKEDIMSLDQARLFIDRMKSDEAFSKRVMGIEDVAGRL